MGWDICAIGTNHKLPIHNPEETAKMLVPLLDGVISIGYYLRWEFNPETHSISKGDYKWIELASITNNIHGEHYLFDVVNEAARRIYSQVKSLEGIRYLGSYTKEWFHSDLFDPPYRVFEIESKKGELMLDIFNENVSFDVKFVWRWFSLERIFRKPYTGENKLNLDAFRWYIYSQLKISGCDKAYYLPDQDYGEELLDSLNLPSHDWVSFMASRKYISDDCEEFHIIKMSEYISGKFILKETHNIICVIDDFNDLD